MAPPAARKATDTAHATLERHALAVMRIAAAVTLKHPTAPASGIRAALWGPDAIYDQAAQDAVAYVDSIAVLARRPRVPAPKPSVTARATIAPRLIDRLAAAAAAARAANRNFARSLGIETTSPDARQHLAQLMAVQASRVAHDAAVGAWREAATAHMVALPDVIGWRRVAEPTACGACLALMDGSIHPASEQMVIHTRDRCLAEPVVHGVNDRSWSHPTGEELFHEMADAAQNRVFAGRGGAAKAQLLRDGDINFSDLAQVVTERLGHTPIALSETPLADLQAPDA